MSGTSMTTVLRAAAALAVAACIASSGCARLAKLWPWGSKPVEAPQAVNEIVVESAPGATGPIPQYWNRNTLVLDLQSVGTTGSALLRKREDGSWPMRLAFRVAPGRFGALKVRADQRVYFPISAEQSTPLEITLAPGVYQPTTAEIRVSWGPVEPPP